MQIYQVGGAVRDKLLEQKVRDVDYVVVGASIDEMLELGYTPVGKDFPVFLHPQTKQEYALARTEKKLSKGYKGFSFYTSKEISLEEDLSRRDLTINAIAEDKQGCLIDPYCGLEDIKNKKLRHVSQAFTEDPVRILRTARFAARFAFLGFTVADETMQLMATMVKNGEVDALVAERVWKEIESALNEKHPQIFFQVLQACGALQRLLPEIDNLYGIPQTEKYHPEIDAGIHTMMVVEQAVALCQQQLSYQQQERDNKIAVLFAALVHDVGKAMTPKNEWPSHKKHEHRGLVLVDSICQRLKIPKQIRELSLLVTEHHLLYHRIEELKAGTIIRLFNSLDAFRRPLRFELFLIACEADSRGRKGFEYVIPRQTAIFKKYYQQACEVNVKDIIDLGYRNEAISEQLFLARCQSLKRY